MDLSMVLWFVPALSAGLIIFAFLSAMFWTLVWNARGMFVWFVALCAGVAGMTMTAPIAYQAHGGVFLFVTMLAGGVMGFLFFLVKIALDNARDRKTRE
jgi:hypothetical protein